MDLFTFEKKFSKFTQKFEKKSRKNKEKMSRKKSILTFLGSFGVALGQGTAGYSGYSNFDIPNNKITTETNNKILASAAPKGQLNAIPKLL